MGAGGRGGPAFCTRCGTRRGPDDRFCTGCGSPFGATGPPRSAPAPATPPAPAPTGRRTGGVPVAAKLAIAAVVLAAGGAAVLVVASPDDDQGQTAVPAVTELVGQPATDGSTAPDGVADDDAGSAGDGQREHGPAALDVLGPGTASGPVSGSFALGPVEQLVTTTITAEGGTVVAPDGLLIDVPAGAYDGALEYSVSKQEILGHEFATAVNPVSPLYTVDNGGTLATEAMWVEVPAAIPPDGFAMGFLYDRATGGIEALPLVGVGTDSVVVATGHFSDFFVHGVDAATFAAIVGVNATLDTSGLDTGFRPGVDDWSFDNWGSYVSPGGHCAGQSLSAMWYFLERARHGGPALHSSYDNDGRGATERWQDDRVGYRLASATQSDHGGRVRSWLERAQRYADRWRLETSTGGVGAASFDLWQFAAFATAIELTREPQYVAISRLYEPTSTATSTSATTTTVEPQLRRGGHAMIVYGVDVTGLWIADPNWSGEFRRIPWDAQTSTLGPYFSGPDAATQGRRYDAVNLMGKTSLIDWAGLGRRFADADAGLAGDDVFPDYALEVQERAADGTVSWAPLTDGYTTPHSVITVRVAFSVSASWWLTRCDGSGREGCTRSLGAQHDSPIDIGLHDDGGTPLDLLIEGFAPNEKWRYVDYARVTVHRTPPYDATVLPAIQTVGVDEAVSFQVEVTNLDADEFTRVEISVNDPRPDRVCDGELQALAGGDSQTVECSFVPALGPGSHTYEVTVWAWQTGRNFLGKVYTEITIEEPIATAGGDVVDALNSFHETVLGFPGEAAEETRVSAHDQWLTTTPAPLEVYSVNAAAPAYVGVYATDADAQAALQAIADAATSEVAANTGADVPWCDWYRVTLDRPVFHGGDSFVLATWQKAIDHEPGEAGIQPAPPDFPWCETSEAEIVSAYGYPVVETSTDRVGWVQGNLVVTLNPAWTPDAAEILHAELVAVAGE